MTKTKTRVWDPAEHLITDEDMGLFSQKESYETPEIHLLHLARWAQRDGIDKEDVIRNLPLRHLTLEKCQ